MYLAASRIDCSSGSVCDFSIKRNSFQIVAIYTPIAPNNMLVFTRLHGPCNEKVINFLRLQISSSNTVRRKMSEEMAGFRKDFVLNQP